MTDIKDSKLKELLNDNAWVYVLRGPKSNFISKGNKKEKQQQIKNIE